MFTVSCFWFLIDLDMSLRIVLLINEKRLRLQVNWQVRPRRNWLLMYALQIKMHWPIAARALPGDPYCDTFYIGIRILRDSAYRIISVYVLWKHLVKVIFCIICALKLVGGFWMVLAWPDLIAGLSQVVIKSLGFNLRHLFVNSVYIFVLQ